MKNFKLYEWFVKKHARPFKAKPQENTSEESEATTPPPFHLKATYENGIDSSTRTRMDKAFGNDNSNIKINQNSARAADTTIGTRAYALGSNVAFDHANLDPTSPGALELLSHELAHVFQQNYGHAKANYEIKGKTLDNDSGLEKVAYEKALQEVKKFIENNVKLTKS